MIVRSTSISRPLGLCAALVLLLVSPAAPGDTFVDRLNQRFDAIPDDRRSELVLLPILASLEPAPPGIGGVDEAALLTAESPLWPLAEAWATQESQSAAFAVLGRVTSVEDPRAAFVYAQAYGLAASAEVARESGLAIELAGGELLAGATYGYLDGLSTLESLVHVEVTRRAAAGEPAAGLSLLRDWSYFCRQICDRPFFSEARWGFVAMIRAFERMRDVVHTDYYGSRALSSDQIADAIARISPDGYIELSRMSFPEGERAAVEQIASRTLGPQAAIDGFSRDLALATTGPRSLRLFGQTTRWVGAGDVHRGRGETLAELDRVYGDLIARFKAPEHSPLLGPPTLLSRVSSGRFAVIEAVCAPVDEIFDLRLWLQAEAVGTRHALGAIGYALRFGDFPPDLSSIRPAWVDRIEADPWNPDRTAGRVPPLGYFVPVRDRVSPEPHEFKFESRRLAQPVEMVLGRDVFVMYSNGPDESNGFARSLRDGLAGRERNRDHIIWPPAITLLRGLADQ